MDGALVGDLFLDVVLTRLSVTSYEFYTYKASKKLITLKSAHHTNSIVRISESLLLQPHRYRHYSVFNLQCLVYPTPLGRLRVQMTRAKVQIKKMLDEMSLITIIKLRSDNQRYTSLFISAQCHFHSKSERGKIIVIIVNTCNAHFYMT